MKSPALVPVLAVDGSGFPEDHLRLLKLTFGEIPPGTLIKEAESNQESDRAQGQSQLEVEPVGDEVAQEGDGDVPQRPRDAFAHAEDGNPFAAKEFNDWWN